MHKHTHIVLTPCSFLDSDGDNEPNGELKTQFEACLVALFRQVRPTSEKYRVSFTPWVGKKQQDNEYDCGLFMLGHAEAIVRQVPMVFAQKDMTICRKRLVLAYLRISNSSSSSSSSRSSSISSSRSSSSSSSSNNSNSSSSRARPQGAARALF